MAIKLSDDQLEAIRERLSALESAQNAVVGCAMFAPDAMRKRDLNGLVERLHETEREMVDTLTEAGIIG